MLIAAVGWLIGHHRFPVGESDHKTAQLQLTRWVLGEAELAGNALSSNDLPFYVNKQIAITFDGFEAPFDLARVGTTRKLIPDIGQVSLSETHGYDGYAYVSIDLQPKTWATEDEKIR